MKDTTYTYYHDAGHGWMAVEFDDLVELGIVTEITGCSYRKNYTVFLEEDCDMSTFFAAYREKFGENPKTTPEGDADWIRNLNYYEAADFITDLRIRVHNLEAERNGARSESLVGELVNQISDIYNLIGEIEKTS